MKTIVFLVSVLFTSSSALAQNQTYFGDQLVRKGRFYIYWGWNRSVYTKSDITFLGEDYDFTLSQVVAKDRQSKFKLQTYFSPSYLTIPQYNLRVGYFVKEHWTVSLGIDHMKYVMQNDQTVKMNGYISHTETKYDGTWEDKDIRLTTDFLKFEHTDGLNYANLEIRRFDQVLNLNQVRISLTEGVGYGILYPRTNTTLLNHERYDEFHYSGYGLSAVAGLRISFFDRFFVQTELKGGYIDLFDIRTTKSDRGRAKQKFYFGQSNIVFGTSHHFVRKNY